MEARGIRLQGERGISRQPIAQGMPECSGCTCMLVCVLFALFAHETAGAASTRHSLLPLLGDDVLKTSGARCRENAKLHPAVIASAAKQSTAPQKGKNGLLRCARNDGDRPWRTGYPPSQV